MYITKTASLYSSAWLASVFWSSTRLLGSEYSTFWQNFQVQSLGNHLSKSLEICCASCPDYGPMWIKISSNSDKQFPSDCSQKLGRKNRQFLEDRLPGNHLQRDPSLMLLDLRNFTFIYLSTEEGLFIPGHNI